MPKPIEFAKRAIRQAKGLKGRGHVPNEVDFRDILWGGASAARTGSTGEKYDTLEPFVPKVTDQGAANTCVARMLENLVAISESVNNQSYDPIAANPLYHMAQLKDGIVGDVGSRIRTAIKVLQKHGCPKASVIPYSPVNVNKGVRADQLIGGWNSSGLKYEMIEFEGEKKLVAIDNALEHGHPVGFGMLVDQRFMDYTGSKVITLPAEDAAFIGGHALTLVGPRNSAGVYRGLNTYGRSWGDHGFFNISQDYISRLARDVTVMYGWKNATVRAL